MIVAILAAFAINVFLQYRIEVPAFIWVNPSLFIFTSILLLCMIIICGALAGNVYLGTFIVAGFFILLTFADRNKFAMRGEHVYPDDLFVTGDLGAFTGMYDPLALLKQIVLIIIIGFVAVLMTIITVRARKRTDMYEKTSLTVRKVLKRIIIRLLIAGLALILLISLATPLTITDNYFAYKMGFRGAKYLQDISYTNNGFLAAFINNFGNASIEEPKGYSEESIRTIVEKYTKIAEQENENRISLSEEDIDIIFVLNESFCDPSKFKDIYPYNGGDVTPNLHALEKEVPSGTLRSMQFGGGTANVEFEAITGFSLFFSDTTVLAFQDYFTGKTYFPSQPNFLKDYDNYETIGLHPYNPAMFKRSFVYPKLGFDTFLSENDFINQETYKTAYYISDTSAYNEIFDLIDTEPNVIDKYIFMITMQNHGNYGAQLEEHPFSIENLPDDSDEQTAIRDYLALLHASDAALGDLAERVFAREKKTIVVFFGDHLPGVFREGLSEDDDRRFETPLLILANFGDSDFEIGQVSPNYLSNIVLDYTNTQKTPLYYLLDDVKKEAPVLIRNYFNTRPEPDIKDALADYYMIMYDIVSGKGYSEKMGFFVV